MNESVGEAPATAPAAADAPGVQLAQWMGRREAFGLMAGRCSAADIEILRRIKDDQLYDAMNCSWSEFCSRHLHVARRTLDREIGYLREFGAAFFTVRQLTHITVKDYPAVAPYVTEQGVNLDGRIIALLPENSGPLTAAIEELLQRSGTTGHASVSTPFDALVKRCLTAADALLSFEGEIDSLQLEMLMGALSNIRNAGDMLVARLSHLRLQARR